ncbi:MAG: sugar phosphate nucleotidyltransferase [Lachnospiraceae bacterium]
MLLAGGQGSRLYALTQKLAKPAVPFWRKISYHRFSAVQLRKFRY